MKALFPSICLILGVFLELGKAVHISGDAACEVAEDPTPSTTSLATPSTTPSPTTVADATPDAAAVKTTAADDDKAAEIRASTEDIKRQTQAARQKGAAKRQANSDMIAAEKMENVARRRALGEAEVDKLKAKMSTDSKVRELNEQRQVEHDANLERHQKAGEEFEENALNGEKKKKKTMRPLWISWLRTRSSLIQSMLNK